MKAIWYLSIVMLLLISPRSIAQCVSALQYITYDTTVTGGGRSIYDFTFPKFDPSTGTLTEVQIKSVISHSFGFNVENEGNANVVGYKVRVDRNDFITSDALLTPIDTTFPRKLFGPLSLTASDGTPGSGSDYYSKPADYILHNAIIQKTVYNTGDYLGTGNVDFEYNAETYIIVPSTPSLHSSSADTITFSITYVVCPTWFLASDVSFFTAMKKDNEVVAIHWMTNTESEGRSYILEKSIDGKTFHYVEKFIAIVRENDKGNYQYQYRPEPGDKERIIFRLKQVEKNGTVKYSPVRIVELAKKEEFSAHVYPNPGNGQINVLFNNQKRSDWIVEVLSLSGQLIERNLYRNAQIARLNLQSKLKKGMYLLKIIEKRSQVESVQRLIIQ